MKVSTQSSVPVYTIAGASTARPLPEWLARKRKRSLKKDAEYANRVELLQDFEFDEASQCVRVSSDGDWIMSTGTYKPQIHTHYLPHLSLSYARHTKTINEKFVLLSSDYTKSLHLQTDRSLEFHNASSCHYETRIPRYGRDIVYSNRTAEVLIPAVGVNSDGVGEVFRLNLELGRFMKTYEVDIGGDDATNLQGSVNAGAVNCAAIAEESHGLMAFGTSLGTVEFWDSRSRNRICVLAAPSDGAETAGITALTFHRSGLQLATGSEAGLIRTYDIRSSVPLLQKDQGYDFPIKNLRYLSGARTDSEKLMSADKRIIKIFDAQSGDPWTSVEPVVDLNHVEWIPDTGMILTANEGRQQHAFLIPQLGSAPRWCAFLDNIVEEMAEDANDPNAYTGGSLGNRGEVYDNYKFVDNKQLAALNLDHLIGRTNLLRPYMHGYFVAQKLYEQAKLISNPDLLVQQRQRSIQERIEKERESRIRGTKKVTVKVNKKLAETLQAKEEANERRKAARLLKKGADKPAEEEQPTKLDRLMGDDRFAGLFQDEDFEIDETSKEFALHNAHAAHVAAKKDADKPRGLTAVEQEDDSVGSNSDDDEDEQPRRAAQDDEGDSRRIGSASYKRSIKKPAVQMKVSLSTNKFKPKKAQQTFGDLSRRNPQSRRSAGNDTRGNVVGTKEVSFVPAKKVKQQAYDPELNGSRKARFSKDRRSASGNTFRRM